MAHALLGLGTNLGDRAANLRAALLALRGIVDVRTVSDVYESEPFGHADQPQFWNIAASGTTELQPEELVTALQQVETQLGRVPTFRMGPRLIDIDILFLDDVIMHSPTLTLPHPGVAERSFVLRPLLDIAPDMVHPITGERLRDCMAAVGDAGLTRLGSAHDLIGGW